MKTDSRKFTIVLCTTIAALVAGLVLTTNASNEPRTDGMVKVPGGSYLMGLNGSNADEGPMHKVTIETFFIDAHEVTNAEFARFVEATNYVTQAEKDGFCWCYIEGTDDFQALSGADWQHPQGPESSVAEAQDHPVVCVSWEDASAYAEWAGKRLPTEAEWEYAARAGRREHVTVDVEESHHHGHGRGDSEEQSPSAKSHAAPLPIVHGDHVSFIQANTWQGTWPDENRLEDGFFYTGPVGRFEANPWGVYDMIGNVWEWTADWYDPDYYSDSPADNPAGPEAGNNRVARGGSWFCSPNYCGAYSSHYRGASPPANTFNNVGFRCARDDASR